MHNLWIQAMTHRTEVPIENEPLQPLKFQTDENNSSFMIYGQSGAIFLIVSQDRQPDFYTKIQEATGMTDALQKKFFMGSVTSDEQLLIDVQRGELVPQGW